MTQIKISEVVYGMAFQLNKKLIFFKLFHNHGTIYSWIYSKFYSKPILYTLYYDIGPHKLNKIHETLSHFEIGCDVIMRFNCVFLWGVLKFI